MKRNGFALRNLGKYFKPAREKLYFVLSEGKKSWKVVELFYSFPTTTDEVTKCVELI